MKTTIIIAFMVLSISSTFAQKFKWNDNKVIAHRGAWKTNDLPENSIASLKQAFKIGCYGSEFDVWMTADSVLVVNHNADFYGIIIETATYKQLLEKSHPNGEKIPTLENYLKTGMKQRSTHLILEIKPSKISKERGIIVTNKCVEMVTKLKATPWVEYISFGYDICTRIIELVPSAKVAYLAGDVSAAQLKKDKLTGADYHLNVFKKDKNYISEAHKLGLTINVWTVNKADDMQRLLAEGADFLTTNEPELAFEEIKKASTK